MGGRGRGGGMIRAFLAAVAEVLDPGLRRLLVLSVVLAGAVLAALAAGLGWLLHHTSLFAIWYLDRAVELLGGLAILGLSWLLFPAVATLVLGFFLDGALAIVEARRYPGLAPANRQSLPAALVGALRLAGLAIALNLLVLPAYLLLPGLNLVLFYAINGWLLGREYFELAALRRFAPGEVRRLWRAHRLRLVAGGAAVAFLLTLPLINLAAPLIGAIFMLHVVERLRQSPRAVL
jgi:CysZ protein